MVRQAHHNVDESPSYDSFEPLVVSHVEPSPDDFQNPLPWRRTERELYVSLEAL